MSLTIASQSICFWINFLVKLNEAVEMTSRSGFDFNLVHIVNESRDKTHKNIKEKESLRWTSKRAKLFLTEWSCRLPLNLWRTDWSVTFVIIRMSFYHLVIYKLKFQNLSENRENKNKIFCLIAFLAACDPEDIFVSSIIDGSLCSILNRPIEQYLVNIAFVRVIKLYLTILTTLWPFEWRPHRENGIQKHHVHSGQSNVLCVCVCVSSSSLPSLSCRHTIRLTDRKHLYWKCYIL